MEVIPRVKRTVGSLKKKIQMIFYVEGGLLKFYHDFLTKFPQDLNTLRFQY